jgi:hypothetical protein
MDTLFTRWFIPSMNEKFITRAVDDVSFALGANIDYDKAKGVLTFSHETAITTFLADNHLTEIRTRKPRISLRSPLSVRGRGRPATATHRATVGAPH